MYTASLKRNWREFRIKTLQFIMGWSAYWLSGPRPASRLHFSHTFPFQFKVRWREKTTISKNQKTLAKALSLLNFIFYDEITVFELTLLANIMRNRPNHDIGGLYGSPRT